MTAWEITKVAIAALLFLGALRGIRMGAWFMVQALETEMWAKMYKLGSYPTTRMAGYAVCCGVVTLILAGIGGAIVGSMIYT